MTSETPIKQILQNQAEFAAFNNYSNFFTQAISPNMISPWSDSVKKKKFSNLRQNDLRRLSDFRHNYSKKNNTAYRSIMELQIDSKQNEDILNENLQDDQKYQTSFRLDSMAKSTQNDKNQKLITAKMNSSGYSKNISKKIHTQEDYIRKNKCRWNEWDEYQNEQYYQENSKKMFQTLSTLNKKQLHIINHSSQKVPTKKTYINRRKLQTTVVDINENANFNYIKKRDKDKQFYQKSHQTVKGFYNLNKKLDISQKNQLKLNSSNKKTKLNQRKFFNKFYFDFSVFGFRDSRSLHKMHAQGNLNAIEPKQVEKNRHIKYSLDLAKNQNATKNSIKIRQLPTKLKSKNIGIKGNSQKKLAQGQMQLKRRCKTDKNEQKGLSLNELENQQTLQGNHSPENTIHQGSIVINLNKMLQQQVKPVPTLNKMTQSSVYRKLRKTLCF